MMLLIKILSHRWSFLRWRPLSLRMTGRWRPSPIWWRPSSLWWRSLSVVLIRWRPRPVTMIRWRSLSIALIPTWAWPRNLVAHLVRRSLWGALSSLNYSLLHLAWACKLREVVCTSGHPFRCLLAEA